MQEEKEKLIDETLKCFFSQFNCEKIHTKIVLEEFFKEIINEKPTVHIPAQKK